MVIPAKAGIHSPLYARLAKSRRGRVTERGVFAIQLTKTEQVPSTINPLFDRQEHTSYNITVGRTASSTVHPGSFQRRKRSALSVHPELVEGSKSRPFILRQAQHERTLDWSCRPVRHANQRETHGKNKEDFSRRKKFSNRLISQTCASSVPCPPRPQP